MSDSDEIVSDPIYVHVDAAKEHITGLLGFDPWSRLLNDHYQAYAFCVPEIVYENEDLRENIAQWLTNVFAINFNLQLINMKWCDQSQHEYQIGQLGCWITTVHIGSHLYMEFAMCHSSLSSGIVPPVPEMFPWLVKHVNLDTRNIIVKIKTVRDRSELDLLPQKERFHKILINDMFFRCCDREKRLSIRNHVCVNYDDEYEQWIGSISNNFTIIQ